MKTTKKDADPESKAKPTLGNRFRDYFKEYIGDENSGVYPSALFNEIDALEAAPAPDEDALKKLEAEVKAHFDAVIARSDGYYTPALKDEILTLIAQSRQAEKTP